MSDLADRVRRDTLELVAKHLESRAEWEREVVRRGAWLEAAAEVREIATRAEFNAITERIQP